MAYVGTFTLHDASGRALLTRRYGASAEQGCGDIVARMMPDLRHALACDPSLTVTLIQDGAPEMWDTMSNALEATLTPDGIGWVGAIDRHHLIERLADALTQGPVPQQTRRTNLHAYNQALDDTDEAIDDIEAELIAMQDSLHGQARDNLAKHLTYIHNNKHRMRYATMRTLGLPVGSGPTEGACKSLVMIRAKGCGQRWHTDGLDAVLTLRGLDMSDRLAPVYNLFAQTKRAAIKVAA
jgi:hypothetical protein